jgi:dienelactone hydrolase
MHTFKMVLSIALLTVALGPCAASSMVRLNSAGQAPTPFQIKKAKAQGIELKETPGQRLTGYLSVPDGRGPFPAIVLLQGCDGIRPYQQTWADTLARAGFVALLVDTYGSRGVQEACSFETITRSLADFQSDAFGALAYLRGLQNVKQDKIAVMGWDAGGWPLISAMSKTGSGQSFALKFAAAVAFYPWWPRPIRPVLRGRCCLSSEEPTILESV